jgi:branched-chain amino acid transport system ATP-binding protein
MVEIARTLILDPSLILMDEPSLGLDPKSVALVAELIQRMTKDGRTVLLIEQNVRLGMYLANDGVVMEAGKVRISAPAKDIAGDPEVASMYLGKTKK